MTLEKSFGTAVVVQIDSSRSIPVIGGNLLLEEGVIHGLLSLAEPNDPVDRTASDWYYTVEFSFVDKHGRSLVYRGTEMIDDLIGPKGVVASEWDEELEDAPDISFDYGLEQEGVNLTYENGEKLSVYEKYLECDLHLFVREKGCQVFLAVEADYFVTASYVVPWERFLWKKADGRTSLDHLEVQFLDYSDVRSSESPFDLPPSACVEYRANEEA